MNKIIKFKERENELETHKKKINRKKLAIIITICSIILIIGITLIVYMSSKPARNFIDRYIFRKNISEEKVPYIEVDYNTSTNIFAYGKNICLLSQNNLIEYNSSGVKEQETKIEINNPVYDVNGKYLVIGEKDSKKIYLMFNSHIVWEKELEGNISKVTVNKNGYVSVIIYGTTNKSVIITYDEKGKELFKTYLSNTIAIDTAISPDNKYFAYAEVNTSGTLVKSDVKIISIQEAKEVNTKPQYTYEAPQNSLILGIKYQDKNKLVCMFDDFINVIDSNIDMKLMDIKEERKKVTFGDINLRNNVIRAVEESSGMFNATTNIEMINVQNQKLSVYTMDGVVKSITSNENAMAVNMGTEVDFINTSGWLIKKYISKQEIRDIVIGEGIAGIVYRDKIELINL